MSFDTLEIFNSDSEEFSSVDYKAGAYILSKHFNIEKFLASLTADSSYVKQLLLKKDSDFESGRAPLYVCNCCADLGCGALTVRVEKIEGGYRWSDFGYEGIDSKEISQDDYMRRTGPFEFDEIQYKSALLPYA